MTINGPWRICFRFRNGDAAERILKREMKIRNLSANRLALALRLPSGRITDILNGKRGISADTALRLGRYFGNRSRFWANLQTAYDLAKAEREIGAKISSEVLTAA
jgi:antitoxin HigA-1